MALEPYCWPIKPFHRAHPVRGYFNDPRISGNSRAFHFGIDISAPDGTPVYAVEGGTVHIEGGRSLSVVCRGGRAFGYWHVVPAVKHKQAVAQYQLLGRIEAPWGHVHFAENWRRQYRDPLRPGALEPWADPTSPRITDIYFSRAGKRVPAANVRGPVDVIVEAYDMPPITVPPPWSDLPVVPAFIRWRVLRGGTVVRPWHMPIDFRKTLLPKEMFSWIYAAGTTQNKPGKPAVYRFFIAHTWSTRLLKNGDYGLQVEAGDSSGNLARAALPFTVAN
jgi:hypothetical protein